MDSDFICMNIHLLESILFLSSSRRKPESARLFSTGITLLSAEANGLEAKEYRQWQWKTHGS